MKNTQWVSITSSGQLTVPSKFRKKLGIKRKTKALIELKDQKMIVKPRMNFNQLSGSLKSQVKLSDDELKQARKKFEKEWANG